MLEDLAEYGLVSYAPGEVPATNYECPGCDALMFQRDDKKLIGWCSAPYARDPYGVYECPDCGTKYMHHIMHGAPRTGQAVIDHFVYWAKRQIERQSST